MVKRFALAGSHRAPGERAWVIGAPSSSDVLDVTVLLQRRSPIAHRASLIDREVFRRDHGADRASLLRTEAFAQSFDLTVTAADSARRSVSLSGSEGPEATTAAFRDVMSGANGAYRAGTGWDPCTGLGSPNGIAVFGAQPSRPSVT
jgi:hypothetical protein